ncbi:MAG: hypothetical protein IPG80_04540 [Anaerolineales bacterium]|uniref:alpha/beta hydrolase n=1 Tax=Candidatus Villigracilis vicinus TaxID=3140679 RepID=UPI003136A2E5|nr:hypothetical protein [Anaerolineales bacterium]
MLSALLVFASVFVVWASDALAADETAVQALNSTSQVFVSAENGWVVFHPAETRARNGLYLLPWRQGGLSRLCTRLGVDRGTEDILWWSRPCPLNLAFFDINAAARIQAAYPEVKNWFVGGHSLGGVAASSYAASHADIPGVVFWASYPADDSLLRWVPRRYPFMAQMTDLPQVTKLQASKALLPADTQFVQLKAATMPSSVRMDFKMGIMPPVFPPRRNGRRLRMQQLFFTKVLE